MKWIALASLTVFLSACGCCMNTGLVEYQQVAVTPVVASPVYYDAVTVIDNYPVDVTTTTIDYY